MSCTAAVEPDFVRDPDFGVNSISAYVPLTDDDGTVLHGPNGICLGVLGVVDVTDAKLHAALAQASTLAIEISIAMIALALIVFFAFFYTAIVFNPTETADNLKKHGGFIPGIRPGERTAEYIDYVLSRITVIGAAYLAVVCLFPEMLISYAAVPFYFGGTSLLIVVSVTMDTVAQVQGYLLAHQYEGLIKRSKLRGRRR